MKEIRKWQKDALLQRRLKTACAIVVSISSCIIVYILLIGASIILIKLHGVILMLLPCSALFVLSKLLEQDKPLLSDVLKSLGFLNALILFSIMLIIVRFQL